jgi:hypothetical protein
MDEDESKLIEACVYAMWELQTTQPTVFALMRPGGNAIPLGELQRIADCIVYKASVSIVLTETEEKILAHAVAARLDGQR